MLRALDIALVATLFAVAAARSLPALSRHGTPFRLAAATIAIAHAAIVPIVWRSWPAYALAGWLVLLPWPASAAPTGQSRRVGVVLAVACAQLFAALAASALLLAIPLDPFPVPDGPFPVGTVRIALVDSSRREPWLADSMARRVVPIQAWYPAVAGTGAASGYADVARGIAVGRVLGLPGFAFSQMPKVRTNSRLDATPSTLAGRWPVIVFSHGYEAGFEAQNTAQFEALASHGYVLVSLAHAYEGSALAIPGGRRPPWQQQFWDEVDSFDPQLKALRANTDDARAMTLYRAAFTGRVRADSSVRLWALDTRFVLDALAQSRGTVLGASFRDQLEAEHVGVLGMSFGGSTAIQFCLTDPRCAAGADYDGHGYGDAATRPLEKPFFFFAAAINGAVFRPLVMQSRAPAYLLTVGGAKHYDFTDFPLLAPPFKLTGQLGPIPTSEMQRTMTAYTLAFFDRYLRGMPAPLLLERTPPFATATLTLANVVR
jgi:predicted dienelactone hydrolase